MAQFHFVEDYQKLVDHLVATKPIDEAMSSAVGGAYHEVGAIERDLVRWAGLKDGMTLVDLGCGSGRLAHTLGKDSKIELTGIDIVQALLDYAATMCPPNYRFILNHALTIPVPDNSADMISAFSLFTHLLHSETYLYMEDGKRVLKSGGKLVFSFLEFANPEHWSSFMGEVAARRSGKGAHLNTLIERSVVEKWADALGYRLETIVDGTEAPWGGHPLWQSVAVFTKP
jgi:ubiquinone/menaquinone biosynthesis C-methylase UbiE